MQGIVHILYTVLWHICDSTLFSVKMTCCAKILTASSDLNYNSVYIANSFNNFLLYSNTHVL